MAIEYLAIGVTAIELVVSYKIWDLASEMMIYDYSGNSRHSVLQVFSLLYTDRGIALSGGQVEIVSMSFISAPAQGYEDFASSFWALRTAGSALIRNKLVGESNRREVNYKLYTSSTALSHVGNYPGYNAISGWNLYTIRLYSDSNNPPKWYMHLYNNLVTLRSFNSTILQFKISILYLIYLIMYEVWAHTGLSSINDLNFLI